MPIFAQGQPSSLKMLRWEDLHPYLRVHRMPFQEWTVAALANRLRLRQAQHESVHRECLAKGAPTILNILNIRLRFQ